MKKSSRLGFRLILAGVAAAMTSTSWGQEVAPETPAAPSASPGGETWYYRSSPEREQTFTVAQMKAQQRGAQRMARLEAMRWYGFSNSRPVASALPYTTMYSPAWQAPGGRPFAWHVSQRPIVIITQPSPLYR